jgi:cell division protein ZapA (FtsZ GTPase activity inhibitor)
MAKKSLKVVVAGRTYPLSVNENEEDRVLKAVEDINNSIKLLQQNYAVRDMQDLLAMTALQMASKGEKSTGAPAADLSIVEDSLRGLLDELKS